MNQHFYNTEKGKVNVSARPVPLVIDPAKTAVIVVDMQNDFGATGGMFDRAGIDISMIQKAVGPTASVLAAARTVGMKIIYLKMGFHPDLSDAGTPDTPNWLRHLPLGGIGESIQAPDGTEGRYLIRETWNTDIIPELTPQPDDLVIYKTRYSGFYKTELDATLQQLEIKHLIITGCTTSVCVESTVRDAMFRDYICLLLEDCMGEPIGQDLPRSNHEASLLVLQLLFAWVSDSQEFISALDLHPAATAHQSEMSIRETIKR